MEIFRKKCKEDTILKDKNNEHLSIKAVHVNVWHTYSKKWDI